VSRADFETAVEGVAEQAAASAAVAIAAGEQAQEAAATAKDGGEMQAKKGAPK
jgi:hypothetical protein